MQPIGSPPPDACPDCGDLSLARIWTSPAIHFKGKGFYATDVGREKQRRLLDRAAEQGANDHDDKMRAQRAERAKSPAADPPKGRPPAST